MKIELPNTFGILPHELTVRDDARIVYLCSECDINYDRPVIATSPTEDFFALRAQRGILLGHATHYGHLIVIFDIPRNRFTGTIPLSHRVQ